MHKKNSHSNLASALPEIHLVEFAVPHQFISYFLESLEQFCDGVRSYETFEDSGVWVVSLTFNVKPKIGVLKKRVGELFAAVKLKTPQIQRQIIENKNWVEELSKHFQPIEVGKFYIYSEFSEPFDGRINIKINPGMAFGTGQHETTYLCLEALQFLETQGFKPDNALDLGCGSGILAIAAAKIWHDTVTAADNDYIAVKVASENAVANKVSLECFVSEGFEIFKAYKEVKFDLILANILMNPLLEMAEDMEEFASGKIILSGFKSEQTEKITEKYSSFGFTLERIFVKNHWVSALFSK